MFGHRFRSSGSQHSILRNVAPAVTAAVALLALLPQAWSATPTFTVANNVFPSTEIGKSTTQNVTLTVNTAVPITSIALGPNFTEYKLGAITGCTIDSSGNTIVAASSVCTIPVTFTPAVPGTASAPPPISRSAPLLVTDVEGGKPNGYSFALSGSATGAVFAFAPGFITSVVGNPTFAGGFVTPGCTNQTDARGDGCPATDAEVYPSSMAVDPAGNIYIADGPEKVIHRVDAVTQIITVYAGTILVQGSSGSGGPATSAKFFNPGALTIDQAGNLYLYDVSAGIWEINAASGTATIIGGEGGYTPAQAIAQGKTIAQTTLPEIGAMLADSAGNLYVSTYSTGSVYKINATTGLLTAIAGNGTQTFPATGVPGVAVNAGLDQLTGLAMDSKGNLYIADSQNSVVYRVDSGGNISAYAGIQATYAQGTGGCTSDTGNWGPATSALVLVPYSVAFDAADNLYIGEPGSQGGLSCPIRRVDATTGIIHNVAGDTTETFAFLSGVGASETYLSPNLVAVDGAANIYVGQQNIEAGVSKISPSESALIFPRQSQFVTSTQLVTASNLGIGDNLTLSNYPFVIAPIPSTATPSPFTNAPLSGTTPEDCSSGTLTPGGVCGILVAYYPTANVVSTATDTVEDNSLGVAGTTNVINISGNAYNGATATLTPNPINFASQPVGTPTTATAVQFGIFLNPLLTIESVAITGTDASSFSLSTAASSPCTAGGTIANGGGDCNLGVIFDPVAGGNLGATLSITWVAAGVTYTLNAPINGIGAQPTPPATPVIYPASNTYNAPVAVAITDATASATIDYSTDSTTPSIAYTAPFTVSQTATVMAFASEGAGNNSSTTNSTYQIQPYLAFNPAAVGIATGSAQTLTALFSFASSATPTAALHYGLDYTIGSVTCTSPTTGIETCSVPVTFIPTLPGPRKDALILSSAGNTIATVFLGGAGNAPLALIQPGIVTNPVSNFSDYIYNSTVDENGTVYFLTGAANAVYSEPKAGGTPTELNITGLANPTGIAVDGAGTLYIAPNSGSEAYVVTYNPQTKTQGTISLVPPAPFQQCNTGYGPYYDFVGVAVDDLGNIYGLESSCQEVMELQTNGTITVTALNPKDGNLGGIAVDAPAGGNPPNIFVSGSNDMNEIGYQSQSQINTTGASSIAVDAADTLYATRYSADGYTVAELASSNYSTPQAGLDGGTSGEAVDPLGLGLGSDDTLYLGNYQDLDKVDRTQGAIAFGEQNSGVASSAQIVSLYNGGNQPLTISNIVLSGSSSGFAMTATTTNSCINGTNFATVAVGALCQISVTITPPHAGSFTGSITFTTNSGNNSKSTAVVALTGYVNGIYLTVSPDPVAFGNQVTGATSAAMTATVTNNGFLYSADVGGPAEVQTDSAFNPTLGTCAGTSLAVGQSCQMSITFDPSLQQPYNDTITFQGSSSGGGPNLTTTFGVTGTGTPPPATTATLTPNPQDFTGQVINTTSAPAMFTLTNNSATALSGIVPTIAGGNAADFTLLTTGTNICGSTLAGSATCNLYVTFTPSATGSESTTLSITDNASNTPQTATINGAGVSFVSNVGAAEAFQAVTVTIATAGTPSSIQVLTQGAANLDFTETTGGTCSTTTAYTAGQTCTVNVVFKPRAAGTRTGAVLLTDASGNTLGTTFLPGAASGPQIQFNSNFQAQVTVLPNTPVTNYPLGVAVDAAGNVYATDAAHDVLLKIPYSGGTYGAPVTIASGFGGSGPYGVAVDGAGNVFASDYSNSQVLEFPWNGTAYGTQVVVVNGFVPQALTVDQNDNLYVGSSSGTFYKIPWDGTSFGTPVALALTKLYNALGIVVDSAENIFAVSGTCSGSPCTYGIEELPWTGSGYGAQTTVASVAGDPVSSIAIDGLGNLYVSNAVGLSVEEFLRTGNTFGTPINYPFNFGTFPKAIAVDGGGNIYATPGFGGGVYRLTRDSAPSLTFATTNQGSTSTDSPQTVTITNAGNAALTLSAATDPAYPADFPENTAGSNLCASQASLAPNASCSISINFTPTGGSSYSENVVLTDNNLNVANATQDIPVSGNGVGVVVNPTASLSPNPLPFGGQVYLATSGIQVATLTNTSTVALTGLSFSLVGDNPGDFAYSTTGANGCTTTLAAGATCNIYLTFTPSAASTESATLEANFTGAPTPGADTLLTGQGVAFSANVGSTETAQSVTAYFAQAGTLTSVQVLTQGATGLDFTEATVTKTLQPQNNQPCAIGNTYAAGQTCTVSVVFAPQAPGSRPGSILLTDSSHNVLSTTYLPGTGFGPEIVFNTGVKSTLPSYSGGNYSSPLGVTVDAALNVYVADTLNSRIIKIPWTGSAYGTPINITAAGILSNPGGIAVDGNGNLFIADTSDNQIVEVPWNGSTYGARVILDNSGLPAAYGIAVDATGNLFFSDSINEKVFEMAWTGTAYASPVTLTQATGLHAPHGLATDSSLNLYIADSDDSQIVELPHQTSGFGAEIVLPATNLFYPEAVAVDAAGDVYIANSDAASVVELPYNGSSYGAQITVPFGILGTANGLAVDGNGNIYVADATNNNVVKLTVSGPPTLTFASTNVGSTSSDSPKTVPLFNIGNGDLTLNAAVSYPTSFPENTKDTKLCANGTPIIPGSGCEISVNFTPATSGPLSGNVVLTDNDLNGTNVTQSIPVSGNGVAATPVATLTPSLSFPNTTAGSASTAMIATLSATGATLNISSIAIGGTNPPDFKIATGTDACGNTLAANASCSIYVTFNPATATGYAATLIVTDNASPTTQSSALNGTGTAAPVSTASLTPNPYVFPTASVGGGEQSGYGNQTTPMITVTNTGTTPITFTGSTPFTIVGPQNTPFSVYPNGTCESFVDFSSAMPPGGSCTITVDFYPPTPGAFAATLSVADSASNSPQTITLFGTGEEPQLQFFPAQLNILAGNESSPGGSGPGESGDGGLATSATLDGGYGIVLDPSGNLYFSDYDLNTVRQINTNGNINVFAGAPNGTGGDSGDNGPAASAMLHAPEQVTFDPFGNFYIADRDNNAVRVVNPAGTISTFYGPGSSLTGPALNNPFGVASDTNGNVYIADLYYTVLKVTPSGTVTTFAGTGVEGYTGDNGPAAQATLGQIRQIATDLAGNVFIADFTNGVVRKVDTTGTITTYAGGGTAAVTIAPQSATAVNLNTGPLALATDPNGDLYVIGGSGSGQGQLYFINTSQQISLIAGGGQAAGSGVVATTADINPGGVAVDAFGNVYLNDPYNHVISEIGPDGDLVFPGTSVGSTSAPQTITLTNTGNSQLYFANQYEQGSVVPAKAHPAHAPRKDAQSSHPNVVDFTTYGAVSGPFAIASGGTCNFDNGIPAGQSCTMNVTFTPTSTGQASGSISLYTDLGANSSDHLNTVLLSGTGAQATAPAVTLNPTPLAFPSTNSGTTSAALTSTLTNSGTGPLTITATALAGANSGDFTESDNCVSSSPIAANGTCTITVKFAPAATGSFNASVSITDNASNSPQSLPLSGTGTAPAVTLNPTPLAFPSTLAGSTSSALTSTLTNSGTGPLTITATALAGANPSDFTESDNCVSSSPIAVNGTCTITVKFAPAAAGSFNASVSITDSAFNSPQSLPLSGTGTAAPNFTISATPATQTVTAGTTATYTVTVDGTNGFGANVSLAVTGYPPGSTVTFSPPQINPGDGPATSKLTVLTPAGLLAQSAPPTGFWPLATPTLALLLLMPFRRWRRAFKGRVLLLVLGIASLATAAALTGCGGGFALPQTQQTYTLTVTGTGGSDTHSTTVQLTVQ